MKLKNSKHEFYFALKANTKKDFYKFAYGHRDNIIDLAKTWTQPSINDDSKNNEKEVTKDFNNESALTEALAKAVDFGLSQYHFVLLISAIQEAFTKGFIENEIVKPITESGEKVYSEDDVDVYGISQIQLERLTSASNNLDLYRKGAEAAPKASLLSIVANFDTLIMDIVGKMLVLNPHLYTSKERTISVKEILKYDNYEDIINSVISDELYKFSRESHEEQTKYISKQFDIKIIGTWKRWPEFVEVFERRNLVAHGEASFNQKYIDKCISSKHKGSEKLLGQKIELRIKYLVQSLDILVEYSILLAFMLWRKQCPENECQAFENLNEAIYKLISNNRFLLASRICEYALSLEGVKVSDRVNRMIIVNYASALRHDKQKEKAIEILEQHDWSACDNGFRICVAAIKHEIDKVTDLIPVLKDKNSISIYRTWPVFKLLHDEEKFNTKLREVYGEDINGAVVNSNGEKKLEQQSLGILGDDSDSIH